MSDDFDRDQLVKGVDDFLADLRAELPDARIDVFGIVAVVLYEEADDEREAVTAWWSTRRRYAQLGLAHELVNRQEALYDSDSADDDFPTFGGDE